MPWEKAVLTSLILRKREARFPQLGVQSSRDICGVDYVSLAHALWYDLDPCCLKNLHQEASWLIPLLCLLAAGYPPMFY